jgi:hypothetical protein
VACFQNVFAPTNKLFEVSQPVDHFPTLPKLSFPSLFVFALHVPFPAMASRWTAVRRKAVENSII